MRKFLCHRSSSSLKQGDSGKLESLSDASHFQNRIKLFPEIASSSSPWRIHQAAANPRNELEDEMV